MEQVFFLRGVSVAVKNEVSKEPRREGMGWRHKVREKEGGTLRAGGKQRFHHRETNAWLLTLGLRPRGGPASLRGVERNRPHSFWTQHLELPHDQYLASSPNVPQTTIGSCVCEY